MDEGGSYRQSGISVYRLRDTTLLHHVMIVVGLPYSFQGQMIFDEITGWSPLGRIYDH